jgi:hypothetical protein
MRVEGQGLREAPHSDGAISVATAISSQLFHGSVPRTVEGEPPQARMRR